MAVIEIKYKNADGFERNAHSPAECVQLEAAGWKRVEEVVDPEGTGTTASPSEEPLTGDDLAARGLDKDDTK